MDTIELKPRFSTLTTSPQKFHDVFVELDRQNSIVLFEVGAQSGWLSDMLRLLDIEFKVANVNHPSWKWSNNPNKSDKNDTSEQSNQPIHTLRPPKTKKPKHKIVTPETVLRTS